MGGQGPGEEGRVGAGEGGGRGGKGPLLLSYTPEIESWKKNL